MCFHIFHSISVSVILKEMKLRKVNGLTDIQVEKMLVMLFPDFFQSLEYQSNLVWYQPRGKQSNRNEDTQILKNCHRKKNENIFLTVRYLSKFPHRLLLFVLFKTKYRAYYCRAHLHPHHITSLGFSFLYFCSLISL